MSLMSPSNTKPSSTTLTVISDRRVVGEERSTCKSYTKHYNTPRTTHTVAALAEKRREVKRRRVLLL